MIENFRRFEVGPDPFGRTWLVEYRWQQTAISIRHSDSVDVKFQLMHEEDVQEKVIALMHPILLVVSRKANRPLTDPWCMKLAALHLKYMIETDTDMDKTLVTPSLEELEEYNKLLEQAAPARA
ncbi:MAG: hypothetical protein ACRD7E_24925 [Bryobacteraceae bacterium]